MTNKNILTITLGIIVTIAIIGGAIFFLKKETSPNTTNNENNNSPVEKNTPVILNNTNKLDEVVSPLTIKGEALGTWFFEGVFPIEITDANGVILGQHFVEAKSEWMTPDYVPFEGTISFTTSTTKTGYLVFRKDNPSGLPENDASILFPISFK
jgi:hypothetical protein